MKKYTIIAIAVVVLFGAVSTFATVRQSMAKVQVTNLEDSTAYLNDAGGVMGNNVYGFQRIIDGNIVCYAIGNNAISCLNVTSKTIAGLSQAQ